MTRGADVGPASSPRSLDLEYALRMLEESELADRLTATPLVEQLAVLGTFDPGRLPAGPVAEDVVRLLCRRVPSARDRAAATLADQSRVEALSAVLARGGREELARTRRSVSPDHDSPLQRALDAFVLDERRPLDDWTEDELLAALDVRWWVLEAAARAGRARELVLQPGREEIESRLALLDVTRAVRRLVADGCLGREQELERLHAYSRASASDTGLISDPPMLVYGIGGVGKSTLVARFVVDLYEQGLDGSPSAWAYLDFDRPTLSSGEPSAVLADISRQVAAQFPAQRKVLERGERVLRQRNRGAGLEAFDTVGSSFERVDELAHTVRLIAGGRLVVVLDTFEEVERKQPPVAERLHGVFAALAGQLPGLRLVVSGRSPSRTWLEWATPDRLLHVLPLAGGSGLSLLRFLVAQQAERTNRPTPPVDDELGEEIVALVSGVPLTLRLAARVLVQAGPQAVLDSAARGRALNTVRSEFIRGFLYQRILDHITPSDPTLTPELRRVAQASLVLRRVTAELVQQVLRPVVQPPAEAAASTLFEALATEVALGDRDGDVLRLREDVRGPALAALRLEYPELVQEVHRRAADYYQGLAASGGEAAVEFAYHRLAQGVTPDDLDASVIAELEPSLDDLPPSAASLLRQALQDPTALRRSRDLALWESDLLPRVEAALRTGRLDQARALLAERPERTHGSELHRLESRVAEAEGDLDAASDAARRDLLAAEMAREPRRFAAAAVRIARLAEGRGRPLDAELALREASAAPLLTGHAELRLQLVLERITLRERADLDDDESRWVLGLDARALLQRIGPSRVTTNTALLRLLAATLGRDEPERLLDAARRVGVGHDEDTQRVTSLVEAVARWDAEQSEPGRLARLCGLGLEDDRPESIRRAWTALAGLGTDAGILLERLWSAEPPPLPVLEAMRNIYVWWAAEPASSPPGTSTPLPAGNEPIRWTRPEMRLLEEVLLTAYPTSTDLHVLADLAGVDPERISWASSGRRITRELLTAAESSGRLGAVVQVILDDPSAVAVRPQLLASGIAATSEHERLGGVHTRPEEPTK